MMMLLSQTLLFGMIGLSSSYTTAVTLRRSHSCHSMNLQRTTNKHTTLFASMIQIDLAESFEVGEFLNKFTATDLQGVFIGFNAKGKIVTSDYSLDIVKTVRLFKNDITTIKIQTFRDGSNVGPMAAYLDELMKQLSSPVEPLVEEEITADPVITSPFENDGIETISAPAAPLAMTKMTVDDVLEEVRPYLIADGGNVKVVSVDDVNKTITLALQGACGSCPSSTTTMKMGIERVLKENFPDLKEVLSVTEAAEVSSLSKEAVDSALVKISAAIKALKGSIEVASVDASAGRVTIRFKGPAKLKQGVELVIKDVPQVKEVVIEDMLE